MKQYWEELKTYLDSNTATKKSELMNAWNDAVESYNTDEDIIEALAAYDEARQDLALKFKNLVKLEAEAEGMGYSVQRKVDYAEPDCGWDFHDINHFTDWKDLIPSRRFDVSTFTLLRLVFEPIICEQGPGSCGYLDPLNY